MGDAVPCRTRACSTLVCSVLVCRLGLASDGLGVFAEFLPHVFAEPREDVGDVLDVVVGPGVEGFFGEDGVLFGDLLQRGPAFITEGDEGGAGVLGVGGAGGEATFFHAGHLPGDDGLAEVEDGGDVVDADAAFCAYVVAVGAFVAVGPVDGAFFLGAGVEVFFEFEVPEDAKFGVAEA